MCELCWWRLDGERSRQGHLHAVLDRHALVMRAIVRSTTAWRWKSSIQPDGGEGLAKRKASSNLRVMPGNVEIGAAWQRTSKDNTVYHSVKLDDPSFSAPIYANLVAVDDGYALVWPLTLKLAALGKCE
jgi:Protein of unknown function (DUF736)